MSPAHESFMRAWQKDYLNIISEIEQNETTPMNKCFTSRVNMDSVTMKCPCGESITGEGDCISDFMEKHKPHTNNCVESTITDDGKRVCQPSAPYAGKTPTAKMPLDLHGRPLGPPQVAVTSQGLRHLDEAVKKVLYFSEHNTPPARRAHPADRVTDNRHVFHRRYYRIGETTNFTEAQQ